MSASVAKLREEFYAHHPNLFFGVFAAEFFYRLGEGVGIGFLKVFKDILLMVFVDYLVDEVVDVDFCAGVHDGFDFVEELAEFHAF